MNPQALRRLKALVPAEGVFIDADRAKRLFDATPDELSDQERVDHVKAVLRMITAEPGRDEPVWVHPVHGTQRVLA